MWIAPDKAIHLAANSSPPSIARPMVSKIQSYLWKRFKGNFPSFVDNSPRSHDRTFSAENMHGYYVHPNRQHPPSTRSRPSENLWKTTIQIHLPPVVLAVLNPIECSGQSSCAMPRGLASETAERTRESANPISRTDCHAWKRYPFWALLSGRRNVICFWRKSSLQCMRLTSVYWFKFCSRQYNDLHRSSTQLSVHRNAPSNTEEIGFPGHGFFFRRTIKCPA